MANPQTSQALLPDVKVRGFISESPVQGTTRNVFLCGHTIAEDTLKYPDNTNVPRYTPLLAGQLTNLDSAVAFCKNIGLSVKFTSATQLDMSLTSELAAMIINAALQYQSYIPSLDRYTLQPVNFYVGVLGLASQNTKTQDPFQTPTTGAVKLFTEIANAQIPVDLFVNPYEYAKGDNAIANNYFAQIKEFFAPRGNSGKPTLGQNWALFSTITAFNIAADGFDNLAYESATALYFPHNDAVQYPAAVIGANMSVHMVGMQAPFYGRHGEVMPNMPIPLASQALSDDTADLTLRSAWTPIRTNLQTRIVYQTRILSCQLQNPVTQIARDYMLDYQDFKIFWLSLVQLYNRLVTSGIINDRFTVNKAGQAPVLEAVRRISINVDQQLYNQGMVAVDPKFYSDQYSVLLDSQNINRIIAKKPLYPSSIVYIIDESVTARNFIPLVRSFNIVTQ